MEIVEFREQFMDELRQKADNEGTSVKSQFIDKTLDELETIGELSAPMPMSIDMSGYRGRTMAFDAYTYDEADSSLVMIVCEFNDDEERHVLNRSRISELCRNMTNFIEESVNGDMSRYANGDMKPLHLAREFKQKIGTGDGMCSAEVLRFKLYILTNSVLSNHVRDITQEDLLGRPVTLNVWTLERFFQTFVSDTSEVIEFDTKDFGCIGLQYLKADLGLGVEYDAYMAIVPGRFLANLYLRYGSRLLQGNIRAFLSTRGKVNRGIRETIIKQPCNFFTYNNGIAVVARQVGLSEKGDKITHFKDFQIINGGQTTASLANAVIRHEDTDGMDTLYVPMKLTVMNIGENMTEEEAERYNNITKAISKCANSQNAVAEADFFSNHPYHTLMEALSRKVLAPPVEGKLYNTTWFYERSRGKWEQEQMKLTRAECKSFIEKNPKKQIIKKEKLAKVMSSFDAKPHQACLASAKCFRLFAETAENLYESSRESINEEYFKKCVCKVIVYDTLDAMVASAPWYPKNGTKMDVVAYTIAKLMTLIPKGRDLDWRTLWNKQMVYPALFDQLESLSRFTYAFLEKKADGRFIHDVSKLPESWERYKDSPYELSDHFLASLISLEETKANERSAERAHKFNSKIDAQVEIFRLGARYWMYVYYALKKEKILSYGDQDLIRSVAMTVRKGVLPSSIQCRRLLKVIEKAEDKGYIMP